MADNSDSIALMLEGKAALARGEVDRAEIALRKSLDRWISGTSKPYGALSLLGKVLKKKGDDHAALVHFERGLPDQECCKGSIAILRAQAKQMKSDPRAALRVLNRMLWISHVCCKAKSIRVLHEKYEVQEAYVKEMMKNNPPLAFTYAERGAHPDDNLLTKSDYALMHKFTFETEGA